MDTARWEALETLLRQRGVLGAAAIAAELGVSQPTVSRLLAAAGERIVRIGRARAARYALAHTIARAGSHWSLYRLDAAAKPERIGELHALHGDGYWFDPAGTRPALTHGDFAAGLYPGLPWFLDDQRPQGFLGRAFARRIAAEIDAPEDILRWGGDDVALALLRHGEDLPGDLVLGEAALRRALQGILEPLTPIDPATRADRYPLLADAALLGEPAGSAAAGEQPKFAITLRDESGYRPVIVKFSDRVEAPAGRRWADLLIAEHLAGEVLREHGLPAAHSEIVAAGARTFLQSTRFDRTPALGRRGLVSLAALDAAHYGHGRIDWWRFAPELEHDGWLDAADARCLRLYGWYGALIGNSDMHLGNAALHLADRRPLALAPCYDMLPMRFRPAVNGEIVERRYEIALPAPEQQADWREAARMAQAFWRRVGAAARISAGFHAIAADAGATLARALAHFGG